MTTREICSTDRWIDRSVWGEGAWQSEPDRVEWYFDGIPCLALRQPSGHWCGYAAVPPGHPWHGKGYACYLDSCSDHWSCEHTIEVDVHGGLTFAEPCAPKRDDREPREQVCHVPRPGEPDDVWWLGFDCIHAGDYSPRHDREWITRHNYEYRTIDYVMTEAESLVRQIKAAS